MTKERETKTMWVVTFGNNIHKRTGVWTTAERVYYKSKCPWTGREQNKVYLLRVQPKRVGKT